MTAQATTVQIADVEPAATNTAEANRIAELAFYLKACQLVGATPDPALVAENKALTGYRQVDLTDNHLVIETQVEPGTLGWTRDDEREPAIGKLIANGMLSVSLTFRGDGLPTVVIENLHDCKLLVAVEDGNDHRLYHGLVDQT